MRPVYHYPGAPPLVRFAWTPKTPNVRRTLSVRPSSPPLLQLYAGVDLEAFRTFGCHPCSRTKWPPSLSLGAASEYDRSGQSQVSQLAASRVDKRPARTAMMRPACRPVTRSTPRALRRTLAAGWARSPDPRTPSGPKPRWFTRTKSPEPATREPALLRPEHRHVRHSPSSVEAQLPILTCTHTCCHEHTQMNHGNAPRQSHTFVSNQRAARTRDEDTSLGFRAFQRNQTRESSHAGLPHRQRPLSGFPTLSAVFPRVSLWLCFKPLPLVGFTAFRAFPTETSRNASRHPFALLSLRAMCTGRDFVLYETVLIGAGRFPA